MLNQQVKKSSFNWKRLLVYILCLICITLLCVIMYLIGCKKSRMIAVDFTVTQEEEVESPHRYQFLNKQISDYICDLSSEIDINPDLIVAILMVENPEFDTDAVHKNDNGTVDCGLFQLNDRYIWTTFKENYWFENLELDPFNWKHNVYLAVHHIQSLQKQLKLQDDVIMAYNCGIGAVMNENIPSSTRVYLAKVKNNMVLLKGAENDVGF